MKETAIVVLALLAVFFGGCVGADTELEPDGELLAQASANEEEGTAGVEGKVMNEALEPIHGAVVRLAQGTTLVAETLTDRQGRFGFSDLEPAEYVIIVSALCCHQKAARITLTAGEVQTFNALLDPLPDVMPHVVEDEWHGLIGCSVRIPAYGGVNVGTCGNLDPNHDFIHEFRIRPGLENVVFALLWEPVATNLLQDLAVRMYKDSCCSNANTFFRLDGASPLETLYGPGGARGGDSLNFTAMEKPWDVMYQVWGGGDAALVYQQPFSIYYHLYYVDPAPADASAIPT